MTNHYITEITNKVFWVGSVDWNLRDFHGFNTPKGVTYNSFLIDGEEPVLVDGVKKPFTDELLHKLSAITDLKKIKHFIVNHIEPDHSGSFTKLLQHLPNAVIYSSEIAKIGLHRMYEFDRDIQIVRSGESLSLGGRQVTFVETPMAHWPDSMVSYLPEDKVLFSSDIFGQFLATSERFDYEIAPPYQEAATYYANIIFPFNHVVLKTLEMVTSLKLEIEYLLPDHGILWKNHIGDIIAHYAKWASGECAEGVLILYDTMWGSTEKMAERLHDTLVKSGQKVRKMKIRNNSLSDIITEIMFSKVVLIGSPTINNTVFPSVGQLLIYMQGLNPGPGRLWGAFGSYGWGGGGVDYISRWFKEYQYSVIQPEIESQFTPKKELLDKCDDWADVVIDKLKKK